MAYLFLDTFYLIFAPAKFERELIKLKDGGTIGLDWDGELPDAKAGITQPVLIMCPGLGGGNQNLYCLALMWKARVLGYKVCTVLFRGGDGIPITAPKLSYSGSWEDA